MASFPDIQLFETDLGPGDVASAPLMEVIRIKFSGNVDDLGAIENAWAELVNGIAKESSNPPSVTHGRSLNVPESLFLGTVGWESLEASLP